MTKSNNNEKNTVHCLAQKLSNDMKRPFVDYADSCRRVGIAPSESMYGIFVAVAAFLKHMDDRANKAYGHPKGTFIETVVKVAIRDRTRNRGESR